MEIKELGTIIDVDFKNRKKTFKFEQSKEWVQINIIKNALKDIFKLTYEVSKDYNFTKEMMDSYLDWIKHLENNVQKRVK